MIVGYLLLAAPFVAIALWWGSWGLVAAAAIVGAVEFATMQRSQRFSARFWRSLGMGKRRKRERGAEALYVISTVAGVGLLVAAVVGNR